MNFQIISVGKVKQAFVLEGEREYLKRLKAWTKIELKEVESKTDGIEKIVSIKKDRSLLILLDESGDLKTTEQFAGFLSDEMNRGRSGITFAIGGAYGWTAETKKKADLLLSLSPLTFTYQMTRLILIEQIYRALSIIKGQPYHKM